MSCHAASWNARSKSCGEIRCVAVPVWRYGGSVDVCWSVARKWWRQNHVKSLGKYEI